MCGAANLVSFVLGVMELHYFRATSRHMTIGCQRVIALRSAILAAALVLSPNAASAAGLPFVPAMPESEAPPQPKLAVIVALRLQLPEGKGLARLLLDAGVVRDDAAAAAQLAAGHLGDGQGGCDAKVEMSRSVSGDGFRLERVVLVTQSGQTVIERRKGALTIASEGGRVSHLV